MVSKIYKAPLSRILTSKGLLNVESITFELETLKNVHIYPGFSFSERKSYSQKNGTLPWDVSPE